jgi:hypothetical protein
MDAALENIEKEDFNILADVSCIIFIIELSDADESSFNFYGKGDENSL